MHTLMYISIYNFNWSISLTIHVMFFAATIVYIGNNTPPTPTGMQDPSDEHGSMEVYGKFNTSCIRQVSMYLFHNNISCDC